MAWKRNGNETYRVSAASSNFAFVRTGWPDVHEAATEAEAAVHGGAKVDRRRRAAVWKSVMVHAGRLERTLSDPNHPAQAYRAVTPKPDVP